MVGKGTSIKVCQKSKISFNIAVMTVMFSGLVIFIYYRGAMNAFLSVKTTKIAINSMEEALHQNYDVVVWENGVIENYLRSLSKSNPANAIYSRSAKNSRNHDIYIRDTNEGIERLTIERVLLLDYLESVAKIPEFYPCKIAPVPGITLPTFHLSLPFNKNSPYLPVISSQLSNDLQQGRIHKIVTQHMPSVDHATSSSGHCEDPKTSLGFPNTFIPFGILCFAIVISLILILGEQIFAASFAKNKSCETTSSASIKIESDCEKIRQIIGADCLSSEMKLSLVKNIVLDTQ